MSAVMMNPSGCRHFSLDEITALVEELEKERGIKNLLEQWDTQFRSGRERSPKPRQTKENKVATFINVPFKPNVEKKRHTRRQTKHRHLHLLIQSCANELLEFPALQRLRQLMIDRCPVK